MVAMDNKRTLPSEGHRIKKLHCKDLCSHIAQRNDLNILREVISKKHYIPVASVCDREWP